MNSCFRLLVIVLLTPVCAGCINSTNTRIPRLFPGRQTMNRSEKMEEKKMLELEDPLPSSSLGPEVTRPPDFSRQRTESRLAIEQSLISRPHVQPQPGEAVHPIPRLSGRNSKYPEVIQR
ncbi:hypothetical protein [Gimesia panareensis]|uniref:Uncharacterized protein n=1 Tax=Gimesia panareensis TaxID=2527978 RepID=A0A518A912_9PLAN|nr:hypothetical protein [Gimesia panareensis]QDT28319.1 hypothetical protein Enr10x_36610 [Gimesia panareensis]QDU51191.1 hypothetical protein Pan110_35550 [Gimesia panareensis]